MNKDLIATLTDGKQPLPKSKYTEYVGDWLFNTLSPVELAKILRHSGTIEPDSKVLLNIEITLFELEVLRLGYIPTGRNCFEIGR
jgi:hypothetical protein